MKHLLLALALAGCSKSSTPPPPASPAPAATTAPSGIRTENDAIAAVEKAAGTKCDSFMVDESTDAGFVIAQREKHGDGCPGDPETSPVRARFRVARDGKIEKYDAVEDSWKPLAK
jgi:hypothetical protein